VDPSAAPARNQRGPWNASPPALAAINPEGLDPFAFRAGGDLWAVVDRLGGKVAFVHGDDGKVERSLELGAAPDITRPMLAGAHGANGMYLVHGGSGRIVLVDLHGAELKATHSPPMCGERTQP
jgi:hypothetical protein